MSYIEEFEAELLKKLNGSEVFRITLTGFLDVHNFDTRRVMKCCIAHLLPSVRVLHGLGSKQYFFGARARSLQAQVA